MTCSWSLALRVLGQGVAECHFSLSITEQVLKFRTKAPIRVMPPEHRTPHGQYVGAAARKWIRARIRARDSLLYNVGSAQTTLALALPRMPLAFRFGPGC